MMEQTFTIEPQQKLTLEVKGDLIIKAVDGDQMSLQVQNPEDLRFQVVEDRYEVFCEADCEIDAPAWLPVRVIHAHGDAQVLGFEAAITMEQVAGDLIVEDCDQVAVHNVGGDFNLRDTTGKVSVQHVGGDFHVRPVPQDLHVSGVGGDCVIEEADGSVEASCGGDCKVYLTQTIGQRVRLHAGGEVKLYVTEDANLSYQVNSGGECKVAQAGELKQKIGSGHLQGMLGSGGTAVEITAGGEVKISDGQPINRGDDEPHRSRWEERAAEKTARALRKAEEKVQNAARRAEHMQAVARQAEERARLAMQRLEEQKKMWQDTPFPAGISSPSSSAQSEPARSAAVPESYEKERLLILQMLADGKIDAQQADQLIAAMEGRNE